MIAHDNIMFHNVNELLYNEDLNGFYFIRVPLEVIEQMEINPNLPERGRENYRSPAGVELRFVLESDSAKIKLYVSEDDEVISILYGDFISERIALKKGYNTIEVKMPDKLTYCDATKKIGRFTPNVVRLSFLGTGRKDVYYISHEGDIRVPTKEELPEKTMLSYGTSITHGASASSQPLTYISQIARALGVDLKNFGIGGSALCEYSIAKYLSEEQDWDFATLCVSVNMVNRAYTLEKYYDRIKNLVVSLEASHPNKHIFCISPYTYFGDFAEFPKPWDVGIPVPKYRDVLKKIVEEANNPYIHYIDGSKMLTNFYNLSPDLIHPSDLGMIEIANNITKIIEDIIY